METENSNTRGRLSYALAWLGAGLPVLLICAVTSGLFGIVLGLYQAFSSDLPSIPDLRAYRPKTVSTFYAEDGTIIGIYYREKRFPIPLNSMPAHVINSFLAAEDARFYSHHGLDWISLSRAFAKNLRAGNFAQGGSTITQQVTRNFLLSKEKKISRKAREAILAFRLERTLSKNEILELYLNEIYLGRGAYGIEAASSTYFGKTTQDLSIGEASFIAGLVSNPSKLCQTKNLELAIRKRDLVLERMVRHGLISSDQHQMASKDGLQFREDVSTSFEKVPYFAEATRQYILAKYGENKLYNEGLKVWTTCDLGLQKAASDALLAGVKAWEKRQGRPPGLVKRLDLAEMNHFLKTSPRHLLNQGDVVQSVVISNDTPRKTKGKNSQDDLQDCTLALQGNIQFKIKLPGMKPYHANDLLNFRVVDRQSDSFRVEHYNLPPVQGAVVCIENKTGYVRSVVGGLDFEQSSFNRATQALRQPGSAFKPFVYAAALEWFSYSPRTVVVDEPIAVLLDRREMPWVPTNSDGSFLGPITLGQALARSRNIAAIKLIMDVGTDATVQIAQNMGIRSPLRKHLSLALGASEVTLLELASAYTVFPNMGMKIQPVLVKKVMDRFGNVLEDNTSDTLNTSEALMERALTGPNTKVSSGRPPNLSSPKTLDSGLIGEMRALAFENPPQSSGMDTSEAAPLFSRSSNRRMMDRVLSPQSAYLMVSMLREVLVSGTASAAARLRRNDTAGKTGTTDDCTDAWFIGFNPTFTTGVWIGYDAKVTLGKREHGNVAALPVWMDFMRKVLNKEPLRDYPVPPDIIFRHESGVVSTASFVTPLEAGPERVGSLEAKPVTLVDAPYFPTLAYRGPLTDQLTHMGFARMNFAPIWAYPAVREQSLRLLSPTGESLGQAIYSRDDKGKPILYMDSQLQDDDFRENLPSYAAPTSLVPRNFMPKQLDIESYVRHFFQGGVIE